MIVLFGSRNNPTSEILNSLDLVKTKFQVCCPRRTTVKMLDATLEHYSQPT